MLITLLIYMLLLAPAPVPAPVLSVSSEIPEGASGLPAASGKGSNLPEEISDLRAVANVDPIQDAVERHLKSIYPAAVYRFEVQLKHVPATLRNLPFDADLEVSFNSVLPSGYEIALITEDGGMERQGAERIQVQITLQALVPVTTRTIVTGERIGQQDLKTLWRDVTRFNEPVHTDYRELLGKTAARRILRDSPVLPSHIRNQESLQAGYRLQMLYRENGLLIELPVVLRQEAAPGQAARAFHHATGRHFEIRITNNKQAEWLRTL